MRLMYWRRLLLFEEESHDVRMELLHSNSETLFKRPPEVQKNARKTT